MAVTPSFGTRELIRCLERLGFTPKPQLATSHRKYISPLHIKANIGQRSFIMVQLNIKRYDSNACSRYIGEIKSFGFTREEIIKALTR